jgi:hypothetical protein
MYSHIKTYFRMHKRCLRPLKSEMFPPINVALPASRLPTHHGIQRSRKLTVLTARLINSVRYSTSQFTVRVFSGLYCTIPRWASAARGLSAGELNMIDRAMTIRPYKGYRRESFSLGNWAGYAHLTLRLSKYLLILIMPKIWRRRLRNKPKGKR